MNLEDAIKKAHDALNLAVTNAVADVLQAALADDRTPLRNALALEKVSSSVGTGGDSPDVVVFGDINGLKNLNDQFGHVVGDAAIGKIGELLKYVADRCNAQAFRRSGDEFIVLLSSGSLEQFENEVSAFSPCEFQSDETSYRTGISFGYAVSGGEIDFIDLLSRAEAACQIAKSQGDGKCVRWTEEIERQTMESLRHRCRNCGSLIVCSIPKAALPAKRQLTTCPCCGMTL
ncbi:MAG TPA: GGDEF domain-containing protein [Pyrinomonadaceae bacterium]|nr:GGDEF domain-containing protein [Pyrinomonadaceae bacterium]